MASGSWGVQRYNRGATGAGQTFYGNSVNATAIAAITPAVDVLHACPFFIPEPIQVDKFEYNLAVAGASSLAIVGLYYNKEGQLYPGNLLVQSAQIDQNTGLEGLKATTLTGSAILNLDAGLYWSVYWQDATASQVSGVAVGGLGVTLGYTEAAPPVARTGITHAATFVPTTGVLPSTFPTTSPSYVVVAQTLVLLRPIK
jgi:hypothetical protein